MIDQVLPGRDDKVRKVMVKYMNERENLPRKTERATRSLIKIFDIEDYVLQEDLAEVKITEIKIMKIMVIFYK